MRALLAAALCVCPAAWSFARGRPRLSPRVFEHLIGSRGLATVERSKGRFRSFLLASFQNFITAENRRARAEKRGGRAEVKGWIGRMRRCASFSNPRTGLRRRRSTARNGHCCFGAAPPSALSKKSSPFYRNLKNTNSSPTKEIF